MERNRTEQNRIAWDGIKDEMEWNGSRIFQLSSIIGAVRRLDRPWGYNLPLPWAAWVDTEPGPSVTWWKPQLEDHDGSGAAEADGLYKEPLRWRSIGRKRG